MYRFSKCDKIAITKLQQTNFKWFQKGKCFICKKKCIFFSSEKKLHSKYAHLVFSAEEYCCVGQTKFSDLTQSLPSMLPPPYVLKYAQFP